MVLPAPVAMDADAVIILRLRGSLQLQCQFEGSDDRHVQQQVSRGFESLRLTVTSQDVVISVCDSPVFIWPNDGLQMSPDHLTSDTPCRELLQQTEESDSSSKKSKKKDRKPPAASVINLGLMTEVTEPRLLSAPALQTGSRQHHFLRLALPMDVVVTVPSSQILGVACCDLVGALVSQLEEMERVSLQHMKKMSLPVPQPFHFLLPGRGLVTVVYPAGVPDNQLDTHRKELHGRFGLPLDRPFLRRGNGFHFPDQPYRDGYLRTPHLHLTPPRQDTQVYLVEGLYSYYHYMQDGVDDRGWGCAYRSLQTLCSWFLQQAYTPRPVPTYREIQQALVDVGDKPPRFLGSCQWIGSIEVQVVLSQLLDVSSKILFLSQGSELASKGRELSNHFLSEGTPIMIGGGVLAHTIVGVAWSETSGQIRYLVLDPHYTGPEDIHTITDKGWCGWKGQDFWDQNAYYNLCLPQRPKTI